MQGGETRSILLGRKDSYCPADRPPHAHHIPPPGATNYRSVEGLSLSSPRRHRAMAVAAQCGCDRSASAMSTQRGDNDEIKANCAIVHKVIRRCSDKARIRCPSAVPSSAWHAIGAAARATASRRCVQDSPTMSDDANLGDGGDHSLFVAKYALGSPMRQGADRSSGGPMQPRQPLADRN